MKQKEKTAAAVKATAAAWLAMSLIASGCSKNEGGPTGEAAGGAAKEPVINTDPVTLTVFNSSMGDAAFQTSIIEPIQKKYPHMKLDMIKKSPGMTMPELVASGRVPDIIFGDSSGDIPVYREMDVLADLTPYIKTYKFDLDALDPDIVQVIRPNFPDGQFLMFPFSVNIATLHYNKDLFDKFGVPYPKDGMMWSEVLDLAKRLTRKEDGVQYIGFDFAFNVMLPYNQLSATMVDAKTFKASVNNEAWKQVFTTMKEFYSIPGNEWGKGVDGFLRTKTIAMWAGTTLFGSLPDATKNGLNWDVVALPSFPQAPKTTIQMFAPLIGVSKTSKHPDQAFLAVAHLMSEEIQGNSMRQGRPSALKSKQLKENFGKDVEVLQGRNAGAFTYNKLAPTPQPVTKYDAAVFPILRQKFYDAAVTGKDVNTALMEAEDLINKELEKLKK
ncbi:ABC transporter substrate-binding protein [Paenibacillus oceani]|uniref:Extracellular solute-binding protein n=1 Tax=Paenibacillus oceani TaxID=2772510 RepID=A0A927GZ13_9BACL|nr:extracellular solute-binding protein [Paenibacillus oceani]MBD2862145.1 extracellular solute-binding protein [Paenibacillus oceani]